MPTPVEHYQQAEAYLVLADQAADPLHAQRLAMRAGVHAQLAAVAWGADDRVLDEVAAGLDAEQVAALIDVAAELVAWVDTNPVSAIPDGVDAESYVAGITRARSAVADLVRITRPLVEGLDR